ncbi:MAG: TonB-dependent receptor [Muribaculaceae bacterium]|nr:TonB-dependent receptor [Muribaculaceae bacterium]MDE6632444.1 TonB-dependent receptor [Muribaculaceae bacterium]
MTKIKLTSKREKGGCFLRKTFLTLIAMLLAIPAFAQNVDVSGTVLDDQGEPLIGVTVMVEGTSNGTATDFDGNYSLKNVPSKGKLVFSYIGYAQQVIEVKGRDRIDVKMSEDSKALDELVVVGYGTIKKADLTGSVSVVDAGQITAKGSASVIESLQGAVPGVSITKSTGRTNGDINVEIRGKSSINSDTKPIYVVDGIITSDISFLNPQDIERVDVLKDASSTAIYGSQATAGVMMITTKSGSNVAKGTKATISYDGYYGISHYTRMPQFMNGDQWYRYRFQKFTQPAGGVNAWEPQTTFSMLPSAMGLGQALLQVAQGDIESPYVMKEMLANDATYYWPGLVLQDGHQQNHYVSVSGAGEKVNYHFGLGYENVQGLYKGDSKGTYSFKGSVDAKLNKVINAGFNFNIAQINNGYAYGDGVAQAYRVNPFMIPYDEDGNLIQYPGNKTTLGTDANQFSDFLNPLYRMNNQVEKRKTYRLLGNIYAQFNIIEGLSFKTTISPTYTSYRDGRISGLTNPDTGEKWVPETSTEAYVKNHTSYGWTWDNILSYVRTFGDHSINAMALYSAKKSNSENYEMTAYDVIESTKWWNMATGTDSKGPIKSSFSESSMISYAVRANYAWKSRYMVTATVRWDGSSKFASGHRWGSFPSVAFGWNIAEESFVQKWWLNNLKLRLSYGVTGNNSGVDNYATIVSVGSAGYYPFGSKYYDGYYPSAVRDKLISWESSHEFNVGLDFGFLNNRITGSIEWYNKKSKDLLFNMPLPLSGDQVYTNVGSVRNTGVEISLTTTNIDTKDWTWSTTFNFAHNDNKALELNGVSDQIINSNASNCLFIGQPVNNVYAYAWDGIVSDRNMKVPDTQIAREKGLTPGSTMRECDYYYTCYGQAEGQPIIRDVNGDGQWTDEDRVVFNGNPKFTGSIISNLTYRLPKKGGSVDFGFSIYAKQGYTVASSFLGGDAFDWHDRGRGKVMMDTYIPAGMLIDADGVRADGTLINPVYQTQTHYGSWPLVNAGGNDGLGPAGTAFGLSTDTKFCARQVTNASFWKVQHVSLGYNFSKEIIEKIGCSKLRLYVNITNPFVWSKYKGFDPEWANADGKNDGPSTITYEFGANITF